ncbi:AIPR family protein [Mesoplasma florum]|uniref:AIPR family protein n=1 Tax=Mesoplasma florum TaxID=2151 RepID=UPI000BE46740|nr:AIPR family protein [Mesoplasma florum]ATI73950.1 abortive phage infection protein [Mesoplasma florum]
MNNHFNEKTFNFELQVKSFRKMESPFNNDAQIRYVMYAKVGTFSKQLLDWMDTNPRLQNLEQRVSLGIKESLNKNPEHFHNKNKGILFSAENITYNNLNNTAIISFDDRELHGNIDGGHTMKIILENDFDLESYVFVEVITGIKDTSEIVELAMARNKNVQVDTKSIAELEKKFASIQNLFKTKNASFKDNIIYKMNEGKENSDKNIDIRDVVSILNIFNLDLYNNSPSSLPPIQSYTSKEASLRKFLNLTDIDRSISKFENIILDIFKLYDEIEFTFAKTVNSTGKRYGARKYSSIKKGQITCYGKRKMEENSNVPKGILFPLIGSFRCLIEQDLKTEKYYWKTDPFLVWKELRKSLVLTIMDDNEINPEYIAKSKNIWDSLFNRVYIYELTGK